MTRARSLIVAAGLGMSGCRHGDAATLAPDSSARLVRATADSLEGRWRLTLTPDSVSRERVKYRAPVHQATVTFETSPGRDPGTRTLSGSADFGVRAGEASAMVDGTAHGDTVSFSLGSCRSVGAAMECSFDTGALFLNGIARGDSIVGEWGISVYCCGDHGRFVLRRMR